MHAKLTKAFTFGRSRLLHVEIENRFEPLLGLIN